MDTNNILSTIAIVVSVGGTILSIFNHKRLRSHCCCSEKEIVLSIDVENTTPPKQAETNDLKINIPPKIDDRIVKARDTLYSV